MFFEQTVAAGVLAGTLQPEEVSAKILQTLLASAEDFCGTRISHAVISVRTIPEIEFSQLTYLLDARIEAHCSAACK